MISEYDILTTEIRDFYLEHFPIEFVMDKNIFRGMNAASIIALEAWKRTE
jgi:hypothetical protein